MTLKKFTENLLLTIPALFIGVLCAVVALFNPIIILWKGEHDASSD